MSFRLPVPIIELGYWTFYVAVLSSPIDLLYEYTNDFLVIESYTIQQGDVYVFDANNDNDWVLLSDLAVNRLSPGDNFTVILFLKSSNEKLINHSDFIYNYLVTYKFGNRIYSRNVTYFNSSNDLHSTIPFMGNKESSIVCTFKIPNINYRGNFSVTISLEVPFRYGENQTLIETYSIMTNRIYLMCDYDVVFEILGEIPNIFYIGNKFVPEIVFQPVKIYNSSLRILPSFIIPEPKLHFFFEIEPLAYVRKSISWEVKSSNQNVLQVTENELGVERYGSKYTWLTGHYKMNFTWSNQNILVNEYINTNISFYAFDLKEDFQFVCYNTDNTYLTPRKNSTVKVYNIDSPLDIPLNIQFMSSGVIGSFSRNFTVIFNDTLYWQPSEIYGNRMSIILSPDQVKEFLARDTPIYLTTRVLYSNMTEMALKDGINVKLVLLNNPAEELENNYELLLILVVILLEFGTGGLALFWIFKKK